MKSGIWKSVANALDIARAEKTLFRSGKAIESGYIRRKGGSRVKITSVRSAISQQRWFSMYVGKNNLQNEELTFKLLSKTTGRFHAKADRVLMSS